MYDVIARSAINCAVNDEVDDVRCSVCELPLGIVHSNGLQYYIRADAVQCIDSVPLFRIRSTDYMVRNWDAHQYPSNFNIRENYIGVMNHTPVDNVLEPLYVYDMPHTPIMSK